MYTIQKYVLEKMKEKGIRKSEFVKRAGYSNISKGCKRFDNFINGIDYSRKLVDNLHMALDVTREEVDEKLRLTKLEIESEIEKQKEHEQKCFVPYLFCQTSENRPGSILVCVLMRAEHFRIRNLSVYFNSLTAEQQKSAINDLIAEILKLHNGQIPTFGEIRCFTLKRFYDDIEAEREVYNLKGVLLSDPPDEYRRISIGRAALTYKGKDLLPLLTEI